MDQPQFQDGLLRLRRLLVQGGELAEQVERGQALRPLGERFAGLGAALERYPVRATILPLDEKSSELCNACFVRPEVSTSQAAGRESQLGSVSRLVFTLGSLDALTENPAAVGSDLASTNLLLVMGAVQHELPTLTRQTLAELSAGAQAVWAIAWTDSAAEMGEPSWAGALKGENCRLSRACLLTTEGDGALNLSLPPIGRGTALGEALFAAGQARATEAMLEVLEDRFAQELRQQSARRKSIVLRAGSADKSEADRALRDATEALRRQIDDSLTQAELALAENMRQRTLPTSTRNNTLGNLLEDLGPQDMAEEPAGRIVRLKASSEFVGRVLALLRAEVQEDLATDVELLRSRQDSLTDTVNVALVGAGSTAAAVRLSRFDRAAAWDALREMIHLDARYHGEMPVRKWIDRLSYGRRPVFAIMMVSSLVGAAFGLRSMIMAWLAPGLLVVFLGGVIWTFRSFREERQERIDRELFRLREALGTEARRLYELVLREWQNRASRHLRDLQRDLVREADDRLRACQAESSKRSEQDRKDAQDKLKALDVRLREYNVLLQQAQRLRLAGEDLRLALDRQMHAALANSDL